MTSKREAFCQAYCANKSARAAYLEAYPKSRKWEKNVVDSSAWTLMQVPIVKARINELKAELRDDLNVTVASVAEEYDQIVRMAVDDGQYAPAVSALDKKCKLFGLYEKDNGQKLNTVILHDPSRVDR